MGRGESCDLRGMEGWRDEGMKGEAPRAHRGMTTAAEAINAILRHIDHDRPHVALNLQRRHARTHARRHSLDLNLGILV